MMKQNNYNSRFPTISFRIDNMIKKKLEKEANKKQITTTALAQGLWRFICIRNYGWISISNVRIQKSYFGKA